MFKYITLILFFLLTNNVQAKIFCEVLSNAIIDSQESQRLDLMPLNYMGSNSLGIELMEELHGDEYVFSRTKENNVIIFHLLNTNLEGKEFTRSAPLMQNDVIVSINDKKVSRMTDEQIIDLIYPENNFNNDEEEIEETRIEILRKDEFSYSDTTYKDIFKSYKVNVNSLYDGSIRVWPQITIQNFKQLYPLTNQFELSYIFDYRWDNLEIAEVIENLKKNRNLSQYDDEIANCTFTKEQFKSLGIWHPIFDFKNKIESSKDLYEEVYEFHHKSDGCYEDLYIPCTEIIYFRKGTSLFNADFNFKAFPIDKQILNLQLWSELDDIPIEERWLFEQWEKQDLVSNLKIANWDVTESNIEATYKYDPYWESDKSVYSLNISIERKYEYYLFKLMIPALLILFISYCSFILPPQQIEARLTVTIVCFLSLIAYNYITEQDLPKLSYLTLMDRLFIGFFFVAALPNIFVMSAFAMKSKNIEILERRFILSTGLLFIATIPYLFYRTISQSEYSIYTWGYASINFSALVFLLFLIIYYLSNRSKKNN